MNNVSNCCIVVVGVVVVDCNRVVAVFRWFPLLVWSRSHSARAVRFESGFF